MKYFLTFIVIISFQVGFAQKEVMQQLVFKEYIHTLQIHLKNSPLSYPIINLGSNKKIELSFDDLESDQKIKDYQYTIVHCNADWTPSDLFFTDYIDGFEENYIEDYAQSFNTFCDFVHYKTVFPNDDLKFLISGNYIIKIYEDYDEEDLVLQARFVVVEQEITIDALLKTPTRANLKLTSQEIDFSLYSDNFQITNPLRDVSVTITQNNRWDNAIFGLKPRFIKGSELSFDYDFENVFLGGNEFRYFDTKDVKFAADRTDSIDFKRPYYHFYLIEDEVNERKKYVFNQDLNGKRFIKNDRAFEQQTESDYVWVHFALNTGYSFSTDKKIYVFGAFSNWQMEEKNKMAYNNEKKRYEASIFLKQGYYNYQYVAVNQNDPQKKAQTRQTEGSHFETENDYIIYVYFRDQSLNYDKLIGVRQVSENF